MCMLLQIQAKFPRLLAFFIIQNHKIVVFDKTPEAVISYTFESNRDNERCSYKQKQTHLPLSVISFIISISKMCIKT